MKKPKKILTDQGRQFISSRFKEQLKTFEIQHIMTTPYNPTGNSIVERINLEIGLCFRLSRHQSIDKMKENIWIRLNLLNNRNTGYSPFEIYHCSSIFRNKKREIKINHELLKNKLETNQKMNIKRLNNKRVNIKLKKNDYVNIRNFSQDKVNKKYCSPYKVVEIKKGGNSITIDKGNKLITVSKKM
ncbi:Gag-Pro-Pol polyprotein [Dictyocoela roeselum]|nr:Gag-Pro-Pol polyprotein [Dictyocoela roeselum]